jgi:membrane dipeptidase
MTGLSRRQCLRALAAAPFVLRGRYRLFAGSADEYSARTLDLVGRSLVIDMLGPLTVDDAKERAWLLRPRAFTEADQDRFSRSGIRVFHNAVGIGGPDAYETVLSYVSALNGFVAEHDRHWMRVDSGEDFMRLRETGRLGLIIGLQNSEHFRTLEDVELFHGLGQRVSQLTYNRQNLLGSGSTERVDGGISDFGVAVVEKMNEVGMVVDVSHCGDRTTLDAMEVSRRPVLVTHSNCRALSGHPRTKTDEAIRKMAGRGGVMGITGVRMFVRAEEPTTIEHVIDHFDRVRDLVGIEHLGVGSDMDLFGYDALPQEQQEALRAAYKGSYAFRDRIDIEGLDHPKRVFDLTEGLVRRGYTDRHIELILGANFERVLSDLWS